MSNYDDIAKRAYEIWEKDGKPEGRETEHWLQAEHEVMEERNPKTGAKRAPQLLNDRGARYAA